MKRIGMCVAVCLAAVIWPSGASAQPLAYVVNAPLSDGQPVELHVINTATGNRVATIPVAPYSASPAPGVPMSPHVLISPDRRTAWVTAGDVYAVDLSAVVAPQALGLGTTLGPLALSADGQRLYVADQSANRVMVVNTATRQTAGNPIALAARPARMELSADEASVFVLAEASIRQLYVASTTARIVTVTITTGESPVEFVVHPDGTRVLVGHSTSLGLRVGSDTLVAYSTTTGTTLGTLALPDFSGQVGQFMQGSRLHQMAILPSGTKLYIPRFLGGWRTSPTGFVRREEVVVVDVTSLTVLSRLTMPSTEPTLTFGMGADAVPDGTRVLVAGAGGTASVDPLVDSIAASGPAVAGTRWVVAAPAPDCWVEVAPQRIYARAAGTTVNISLPLAAPCQWNATKMGDFFTASPLAGTGPLTITVNVPAGSEPAEGRLVVLGQTVRVERLIPHVTIDTPVAGNVTLPFALNGWALERRATPPSVDIDIAFVLDQVGTAPTTLRQIGVSGERADVAAAYGDIYLRSGFGTTIGRLSAGTHTLSVQPRSATDGTLLPAASVTVNVQRQPLIALDAPLSNASVSQPFIVRGWAADMTVASGTGVDTVHLWAQPNGGGAAVFVGAATMGIVRGDVGAFFNEQPLAAGFEHTVTGLAQGRYTLTAYAHYTATNSFERTASVEIAVDLGTIDVDRSRLTFASSGTARTGAQTVRVTTGGTGAGQLGWSTSLIDPFNVLELRTMAGVAGPVSGTGAGAFMVALRPGASLPGASVDLGAVRVLSPGAGNAPLEIPIRLEVVQPAAPWGHFDTPSEGSTVRGTIAVTGWALDDIEVTRVAIFRDPVGSETGQVFLGDALFVEGARPDVAALYPSTPRNARAGWGLSVLTNMLPNQGNGAIRFHAYAYDVDGRVTHLGTKSVTGANSSATTPFGTIDLPAQGSTVSGQVVMFGWALTPGPAIIPTNGSTIEVLVDGVSVGNPTYNQCRGTNGTNFPAAGTCNDDIATLFGSGYRNIAEGSGAIGSFVLDTTRLTNGLHQIEWRVTDSLGRVQGIGSRFIYVQN